MGPGPKIALIADWLNPCIVETVNELRGRGACIDVIYPESELIRLDQVRVDHDLYVLKSGTDAALTLAGMFHALGAATLNPYPTVARLRNKVLVTHGLQAAGLPVPESYVASAASQVAPLLERGPVILKPYRGSRGEGVQVVDNANQLRSISFAGPMVVQRYHPPDGPDRKLYRIGDRLFGVLRRWPLRSYADKIGNPFEPEGELREIGYACGDVFGLDLYGLDVVVSEGRPLIVDLNKFGSFMGVPDAPRLLADHLLSVR